jgi:predicted RNA-binding protein with PUA-like domain
MAKRAHWLIKSEPSVYPWSQLVDEGETEWTGIRSFEARNNLRAMKPGDLALYYHSGEGKEIVGVAKVLTVAATADSTAPGEDWASVRVASVTALKAPVTLAQVKKDRKLAAFPLVTRSRLSVAPVTPEHFEYVLSLARTRLPRRT